MKNWNAAVRFFKQAIRMDDKETIAMVDTDAIDIGRYITPTINATTQERLMQPQSIERLNTTLNRARVAAPPELKEKQICLIGAPDAYRATYNDVCQVVDTLSSLYATSSLQIGQ